MNALSVSGVSRARVSSGLRRVLHQRQPHQKARALGAIALGANGAAVLLHNLGRDRKTQPRAAMFGGVEGQEQPLANLVGEPMAGVGDFDFNRGAVFAERSC